MQLTIDSTESINTVLPAVGALYGVEVQVVAPAGKASVATPSGNGTPRRRAAAKRVSGKSPGRGKKAPVDDSAQVREWARAHGFQVADRGRISAAIRNAYRAA